MTPARPDPVSAEVPGPAGCPPRGREGFVLAVVVFMLFAIGVAAAASYQIVATEFTLAAESRDSQQAIVVARAGLSRYLGEQIGMIDDSVDYAVGSGTAVVTATKILEEDSLNHLYYVRSVGSVPDLFRPGDPSARTVGTYAWHRISPVPHIAALVVTDQNFWVVDAGNVDADEIATTADCPGGNASNITGGASSGRIDDNSGGRLHGHPNRDEGYADWQAVYDAVGLRWDLLSDPSFPVEHDGTNWPSFASLPADSFPLVRQVGTLMAGPAHSGRGVMIVTGALILTDGFTWDGIIVAGSFYGIGSAVNATVRGLVIAGLSGGQPADAYMRDGDILYHSCNVYAANRALSYLEVVTNTTFESF